MAEGGAARRDAWRAAVGFTSVLAKAHDVISQIGSLEIRAARLVGDVARAGISLRELARLDLPGEIVPVDLQPLLEQLRNGSGEPDQLAHVLLAEGWSTDATIMAEPLAPLTEFHLWALHATVLVDVVDAAPDAGAASAADLALLSRDIASHTKDVRDAARAAATELASGFASPAFSAALWAALFRFENWLVTDGVARLAAASAAAAASARVAEQASDAGRWAREVGQAYDGIRYGLAFDAGVRAVLLACAVRDDSALADFAGTARLPIGTRTEDHPRSDLADVAAAREGSAIEIDGLVSAAEFRVGGPSNRSVLTLSQAGSEVRVLVPHVAIDSFGVAAGVWVQVRGTAFPEGKDGINGPLVMAGRIPWAEAAEESFTDALVFAGRRFFELRPGGIDIVAGRMAGTIVTLSEIGLR
jgi:hypothetical protein